MLTLSRLLTGTAAWFLADTRHGEATRVTLEVLGGGLLRLSGDGNALNPRPAVGEATAMRPEEVLVRTVWQLPDERLAWPHVLAALSSWRLEVHSRGRVLAVSGASPDVAAGLSDAGPSSEEGTRFVFEPDPRRVQGELQSPEVLYALRDQAARWPEARFTILLPPGTRDVQRARAGLDSRPPACRPSPERSRG